MMVKPVVDYLGDSVLIAVGMVAVGVAQETIGLPMSPAVAISASIGSATSVWLRFEARAKKGRLGRWQREAVSAVFSFVMGVTFAVYLSLGLVHFGMNPDIRAEVAFGLALVGAKIIQAVVLKTDWDSIVQSFVAKFLKK